MERNCFSVKKFITHPAVVLGLKIAVSLSLLLGLVFYIDFNALLLSFQKANTVLLLFGFSLVFANIGIHFLRWRYLLRLVSPVISDQTVFASLLVGLTAGFFTPGQIGEFAGRIAAHPDLKKSHVVGVTLIDKLYLLSLTLITGIASISFFIFYYSPKYWKNLYEFAAPLAIALIVLIFLFPEFSKKIFSFIPAKIRENKLFSIIQIIESSFHNRQGRILFGLTALLYGEIFFQFFVFALSFSQINFFDSFICSSSVYFIKAVVLPISIGDLGVRESASVFFFAQTGYPAASAFNASLCMFAANLILPSIVGALFIIKLKTKQW